MNLMGFKLDKVDTNDAIDMSITLNYRCPFSQ